jgi:GNAT superfamily N-acetyltransferase
VLVDDDGADAGCGGIRRVEDGPAGVRYEVKHLYLQPRTRGRGWGRLLLDALEERPRSARPSSCSTPTTRWAAGALYARAGFTAIEPYNDNPNATRWYGKVL